MPGGTTVVELQGEGVLDELGPALDEIHTATGAPLNTRRPWLSAWIRTYRAYEPWAITVRSGDGLTGAALLARRRHLTGTEVIGLGQGPSDYQRFAVLPEDAPALADAVAGALARLPSPWRLHVEQLPDGEPAAAELAHRLGAATVEPGDAAPRTRFGPDRSLTSF